MMIPAIRHFPRQSSNVAKTLRLALVQIALSNNHEDKVTNLSRVISFVEKAKQQDVDIVILPEFFHMANIPYRTAQFAKCPENIPAGDTCRTISRAAEKNEIYVVAGSIFEQDGDKVFNTSTVWNPEGKMIAKYRKLHLFDVDIRGKITFRESDIFHLGNSLMTFLVKEWKIGLGICYDIRFEELARLYRNLGCQLLIYPSMFGLTTGPKYWSILPRARAVDNQVYVAGVCPARRNGPGYLAYGHTQLVDPWGSVVKELGSGEDMIVADIDLQVVDEARTHIPIFDHRRTDLYETIWKEK